MQISPPKEVEDDVIRQAAQRVLADGVEALKIAPGAVVEGEIDVDGLDQLEPEQRVDVDLGHLLPGLQLAEHVADTFEIGRRLAVFGKKLLSIRGAHTRVVEIDRNLVAGDKERAALQIEGLIGILPLPALGQEQVLAGIETEHGAAIESTGLRILREE